MSVVEYCKNTHKTNLFRIHATRRFLNRLFRADKKPPRQRSLLFDTPEFHVPDLVAT